MSTRRQQLEAPRVPWSRALVVGMGASGRAALKLLRALGVEVHAYDAKAEHDDFSREAGARSFCAPSIPEAAFAGIDLVVLSPGVPPQHCLEQKLQFAPNAHLHGELSLALDVLRAAIVDEAARPALCLITGTNAKSTITALTAHLLEADGQRPFAGGNLGVPLCTLVHAVLFEGSPLPTQLVLECSSYQLETLGAVPTQVAILSNLSPDHLARYASLETYAQTKTRVFAGLGTAGLALLDGEDDWTPRLRPPGRVELVTHPALELDGDTLVVGRERFERSSLGIAGRHNAKNALFALRAAIELGASPEACRAGLASFEGLAHRMAFVREHEQIHYYNDSKATNVASVLAGLRGFERPFVLIAGGQLKGEDLNPLIDLVAQEGIGLVALGEGKSALLSVAGDRILCEGVSDMPAALAAARAMAKPGNAVVLSPAGASWDMYANFGARGDHFSALVKAL